MNNDTMIIYIYTPYILAAIVSAILFTLHIILYSSLFLRDTRHRLLNKKRASVLDLPTISPLMIKGPAGRCTTLN